MLDQLRQLSPRTLGLVFLAAVGLTLLASYLYVVKRPLAEYRRFRQTRTLLEAELEDESEKAIEIARLSGEVEALENQLARGGASVPVNQMVAHIIDRLDRISETYQVQLVGVKPGTRKEVFMFEEVPFDVEITGEYFSLFDWLREVEQELGPMVVKQYEILPENDNKTRMKLTMVSYRSRGQET